MKSSSLRGASSLERKFVLHWGALEGPELRPEHRFNPDRKWRFDFAHPHSRVAIECEGGTWSGGRHSRGSGFEADCEKYNDAAFRGWRVVHLTSKLITPDNLIKIITMITQHIQP